MLRKFWRSGPIESVGVAAGVIALAGIASRVLGLLRDRLLAAKFGAGDTLDVYYAAFRIPDTLYGLLVAGALSAAFVPVFTELITKKREEEAWRLSSGMLSLLGLTLAGLGAVFAFFAPDIIPWLTPGFSGEKQAMTATLTRIMLLSAFFLGLSAVLGGVLISFRSFVAYSLAPLFYNLGIIFGAGVLSDFLGPAGLAWGVVAGAFLHFLIQVPEVVRAGFRFRPVFVSALRDPAVVRVAALMVPRALSMGINQASLVVMTVFASLLASGSLAVYIFATNIQSVPLGLFGIAFALAVFPMLSRHAAEGDSVAFFRAFAETFRRILFFVLPLSVLLIVARAQVVRVLLGSGQFDWDDTRATFGVLGVLSVSLFAQSLLPLLTRAYFALQNTWTPLYVAAGSELIHIGLTAFFIRSFQDAGFAYPVIGVALAFTVAALINCGTLFLLLRRKVASWHDRDIIEPSLKIVLASLGAGLMAQLAKMTFGFSPTPLDTFVEIFVQLVTTFVVGATAFWWFSVLLGIEEFERLKRFVMVRVLRRHPESLPLAEQEAGER